MNLTTSARSSSAEELLAKVVDELTERLNRGEEPAIVEYAERYPEIADLLREVLPALKLIRLPGQGEDDGAVLRMGVGTLGDFRIFREIGRGGMGVVYEAEQISLGRRVALKVLPFASTLDAKQLQRFKNEAQAAAGLHHTNIVPVFATGCERGVHFYAMQFIDGQTLAQAIEDLHPREPLAKEKKSQPQGRPQAHDDVTVQTTPILQAGIPTPPVAALSTKKSNQDRAFFHAIARIGVQAAEALDYSHELGVVHRDIKPANMLIDAHSKVWITDFGLARCQAQAGLTMTGDLVGTLRYMSPEQALAKRVVIDHRTDIYSLGATLYELLTGEPVFSGNDREELLRQIAFEDPSPPRRVNNAIPAELETIVLKALEKNPVDRYATAKEMAEDLERFVKDEPIKARRPSLARRVRGWCRKHKLAVFTLFAALSAALLAGGAGLWRHEHHLATKQRAHLDLSRARDLFEQERHLDAETSIRKSIELDPDHFDAYVTLGNILGATGRNLEALALYETKISDLTKQNNRLSGVAAFNYGNGLAMEGRWSEAAASYRRSIELQPTKISAYEQLSNVLDILGDFTSSLGPQAPSRLVKRRQWLATLEAKLPRVLSGEISPVGANECLGLAIVSRSERNQLYKASANFFAKAFQADKSGSDRFNRWEAACIAALAGCGHGKDAVGLDAKEYARLRGQALTWLQAHLDGERSELDEEFPQVHGGVRGHMQRLQRVNDFDGVRDADALAKLPDSERRQWEKLWQYVRRLERQAAEPETDRGSR